jgi:hypothetical protein
MVTRSRILITAALSAALISLAGCYSTPVIPPIGQIYSDYRAPLTITPVGQDMGSKVGRAESVGYLGLVAMGDCSVEAACADGGISVVKHIDYEFKNMVGVIQRFTIVVHGD